MEKFIHDWHETAYNSMPDLQPSFKSLSRFSILSKINTLLMTFRLYFGFFDKYLVTWKEKLVQTCSFLKTKQ